MANPKRYTDDCALGPFSTKSQKTLSYIFSPTLWTPLLFLLMELRTSGEEAVPTEVIGTLGGFMTLPLNISVGTEIEHVAWNGPQKTLALASPAGAVIILDKSYQSRLSISSQSYSLNISKLTPKDEGLYRAQINRKNSNITIEERFVLHIYEQLQKPRVTVKHTMSESTSCNLTLVCSVERAEKSVLYSWTWVDTHSFKSFESSTLTISWMPCDPDVAYTCTAKNPVSQSTSSPIHAQQFCADLRASRGRTVGETVVGTLGESVTLSLTVPVSRDIEKVVWMFNTSIISKDWREPAIAGPLMKSKEPGKDRVWVSDQDYTLKISQLKMEDTGPYNAYLCLNTPRLTSTQHFTLRVYRRLKKPEITWIPGPSDDSICRVTLMCSVEDSGDDVTYRWTFLQKGAVASQEGSLLNVSWRSSEYHPNFTCTAMNPISNSSWQFLSGNICPGPSRSMKHWIILFLITVVLLCFGFSGWCIWKQKRQCSAPAFNSSQVEAPADLSEPTVSHSLYTMLPQGCKKLDTPPKTARQWPRTRSNNSSDSNLTTEEDKETTEMQEPVSGRDMVYDLGLQEDTASNGQAEYDLVTPNNTVPESVAEVNTVYAQVFFNSKGKTPVPQKKDSSYTVYCSVQKPQLEGPPPQQNDESPEISPYENFS
ncbi:T-lymphocyte surface antigen Ly-9 isoform X2 [Trichechus manatus latirostris]|uniref:T-lymphocyte surface antigen Ly-9 isoform X2 n=1 Tax=Trichechus manatus latirostris TaxID=127582 RepID=A0A2Y9QP11_TRIMA|nr:T-lymphocyte surface antigen Ly-9 isoform X2 [Trichechus manatus latirostris]